MVDDSIVDLIVNRDDLTGAKSVTKDKIIVDCLVEDEVRTVTKDVNLQKKEQTVFDVDFIVLPYSLSVVDEADKVDNVEGMVLDTL